MEECVRMMQQSLRSAPTLRKKAKTVYNQRNLGTIKDKKRQKREAKDVSSGDVIMRILRMRYKPITVPLNGSLIGLLLDLGRRTF
jgi:hypothetical protein